jgi:ABC-2 type transport system ATP-binding protein
VTTAVETRQLRRTFRPHRQRGGSETVALDDFSLTIEPGEVHGLLGPNGAGKTTLVKVLSTVLLPTAGGALVLGRDVVAEATAVRRDIGIVLGGERGLYERVSARQNLAFWATLYGLDGRAGRARTADLLERVGLADHADEPVERLSRGMKQRVHLARGLIHDPPVLFLDEPTTGLDPVAARELRALIEELRAERRTVLLTTHDMAEAEAVCQRVSLIDYGRLLGTEDTAAVGRWLTDYDRIDFSCPDPGAAAGVAALVGVAGVDELPDGAGWRVRTSSDGAAGEVLRYLTARGVTSVRTSKPTLEEVYLHVFGERGLKV